MQKCVIGTDKVKYLGHEITKERLCIDKTKVSAIRELDYPKDRTELARFLGMTNYVSKFILNYSDVTASLRQLNKKDVPFIWGKAQEESYKKLINLISSPPVLAFYNVAKPIVLSVDASSVGLGGVLLQDNKPIAYCSKALTETEKGYSQIEKECLAILFGCTHFHQYLCGQSFTVETDHKPLVPIFEKTLSKCPIRLQRIRLGLQPFNFRLVYKPGKELVIADHLSRSHVKSTEHEYELEIETHVSMLTKTLNVTDHKLTEIKEKSLIDKEIQNVLKYVKVGWPEKRTEVEIVVSKTIFHIPRRLK